MLAFVQDQVVNHLRWISAQQFLDGLTLGQFTPGPIMMLAAYIGYKLAGIPGATVATIAIFLPSFLLMMAVLPVLDRVRQSAWVKAGMTGIIPAVVGSIAVSFVQLAPHAAPDLFAAALLVTSVFAMMRWRVSLIGLLLGAAMVGIVVRL